MSVFCEDDLFGSIGDYKQYLHETQKNSLTHLMEFRTTQVEQK